jgi:hypothetical protein
MVYCIITAKLVAKIFKKERKHILEKHAQSLEVYRLNCETFKQTYIDKTERIISQRTLL